MTQENHPDKVFLSRIKDELDKSVDDIDELTLARLGSARRRAAEKATLKTHYKFADVLAIGRLESHQVLILGLGLILIVALWLGGRDQQPSQMAELVVVDDIELLKSGEEFEFLQDMEFYLWATSDRQSK